MLYESRIYYTVPGRLTALNDRFANHTLGFFQKHGIGVFGFWTDEIATSNKLTYILTFDNMADREAKWSAFQADTGWHQVRAESEADGPIVAVVENAFMRLTPYSPEPHITTNIQELHIYDATPGKFQDINDRFANHTIKLFEKHGIENIA